MTPQDEALLALEKACRTFNDYATLHWKKNTPDGDAKARANEALADEMATALRAAREHLPRLLAENAKLREALRRLEDANDALCAKRSLATYDSITIGDGATEELLELDEARRDARAALEPQP